MNKDVENTLLYIISWYKDGIINTRNDNHIIYDNLIKYMLNFHYATVSLVLKKQQLKIKRSSIAILLRNSLYYQM